MPDPRQSSILPPPFVEPVPGYRYPSYDRVDAMERDEDGNLRLYRRRGPFGLLRRQEVFHPKGEWVTVYWHPSGRVQVTTSRGGRDAA